MSRPSLTTRFYTWFSRIPSPGWLKLGSLLLLLVAYEVIAYGLNDLLPAPQWSLYDIYRTFAGALLVVAVVAFNLYLNNEIAEAVDESRSISGLTDAEFSRFRHQALTTPFWPEVAILIILAPVTVQVSLTEEGLTSFAPLNLLVLIDWLLTGLVSFLFTYRVIRLIVLIGRFYSGPIKFDLFDLAPVYEISTATSKGGFLVLVLWYVNIPLNLTEYVLSSPIILLVIGFLALIPLAAFLVPQAVVSRRLTREKASLSAKVSGRLKTAFTKLNEAIADGQYDQVQPLRAGIEGLLMEKQFVDSIPTWPWRFGAFRVALTAVLLPIFVWLIQQLLDRVLGF